MVKWVMLYTVLKVELLVLQVFPPLAPEWAQTFSYYKTILLMK